MPFLIHNTVMASIPPAMNAFGISNWLTGLIYIIVVIKAKDIVPYILLLIPSTYILGIISNHMTGVSTMQSTTEWNGQYVMYVYLFTIALVCINYFFTSYRDNKTQLRSQKG